MCPVPSRVSYAFVVLIFLQSSAPRNSFFCAAKNSKYNGECSIKTAYYFGPQVLSVFETAF